MALYTQTGTTDLTAKGRRVGSIHVNCTAAGTLNLRDGGAAGTIRYQFVYAAAGRDNVTFGVPVVFNAGVYVEAASGTYSAITLDIL